MRLGIARIIARCAAEVATASTRLLVGALVLGCGRGSAPEGIGVGEHGILDAPVWTAQSDQINASFGYAVSRAGDVDGDGFDDVLVGAPAFDAPGENSGEAFLYLGTAEGVEAAAAWTAPSPGATVQLGHALSDAGDVDGDGFADVLIGVPWVGPDAVGEAHLYLGSSSGLADVPDWIARGTEWMRLGDAVANAGDVDGDGYDDVIIGAFSAGTDAQGSAHVYLGGPDGLDADAAWSFAGSDPQSYVGTSVSTAGDVDGDGYDDVLVGATGTSDPEYREGAVYLFLGSPTGPEDDPAWSFQCDREGAFLGSAVSFAGDVDADGFDDVIVSAKHFDEGEAREGKVFFFRGSAEGLATEPSWSAAGDQIDATFGDSLRDAGDVNADGFGDFLVGAVNFDVDLHDDGAAFLFTGSADGPEAAPAWTGTSGQEGGWFGGSVSGAGDVNGDGHDDLLVGAEYADEGQSNEGMAFVFLGDCTDGTPCPGGICRDGVCDTGGSCRVDGAWWEDGAANPENECERCDAASDRLAWTPLVNGTPCAGGLCVDGVCSMPDAGPEVDAGPDAGTQDFHASGCSCACRAGGGRTGSGLLTIVAAVAALLTKRRCTRRCAR